MSLAHTERWPQHYGVSITPKHLSMAEASLEKLWGFPLFAASFFALCHPVWTHQTVALKGSLLINISQSHQPSKHTSLCCWHQPCS